MTGIEKTDNRFRIETMLNIGMRYEELRIFEPKYFSPKTRYITLYHKRYKDKKSPCCVQHHQFIVKHLKNFILEHPWAL